MNTAKTIVIFLWGALLASGIWASCWWWPAMPCGPNNFPIVGGVTAVGIILTVVFALKVLFETAFGDK